MRCCQFYRYSLVVMHRSDLSSVIFVFFFCSETHDQFTRAGNFSSSWRTGKNNRDTALETDGFSTPKQPLSENAGFCMCGLVHLVGV